MKIYGVGVFKYPNTGRIVHDFADGPFSTFNPVLIRIARRLGYSLGKPLEAHAVISKPIKTFDELGDSLNSTEPIDSVRVKRKYTKRVKNGS